MIETGGRGDSRRYEGFPLPLEHQCHTILIDCSELCVLHSCLGDPRPLELAPLRSWTHCTLGLRFFDCCTVHDSPPSPEPSPTLCTATPHRQRCELPPSHRFTTQPPWPRPSELAHRLPTAQHHRDVHSLFNQLQPLLKPIVRSAFVQRGDSHLPIDIRSQLHRPV